MTNINRQTDQPINQKLTTDNRKPITDTSSFILQLPNQQIASTSSDSSYSLQVKNIEITERPRLEHLKYYFLAKLSPFQIPLLAALILLSLAILLRKIKKIKRKQSRH